MRGFVTALAALPLAAGSPLFIDTIHSDAAPIISSVNSKQIPNSYIVVFKDHVTKDGAEAHHSWVQSEHDDSHQARLDLRKRGLLEDAEALFEGLKHTYHMPGKLLGYSGHFDDELIEKVRMHPDVRYTLLRPCTAYDKHYVLPISHLKVTSCFLWRGALLSSVFSTAVDGISNAHVRFRLSMSRLTPKSTP